MDKAYMNTQRSVFCLLPYFTAAAVGAVGVLLARVGEMGNASFLLAFAAALALIGLSFQQMIVRGERDGLSIRFGPLPLVRTRISYADIRRVERDHLRFFAVKCGRLSWKLWRAGRVVWSVGGNQCVIIHRQHDAIRIVTRDADQLVGFLQPRIISQ